MSYNTILVEKDGPALVIILNRPESRNSFSVELMGELAAAALMAALALLGAT